ncbi:BTB/POZ and TAZ domain-containing protein 2 [Linum grandiflorum]
MAEQQSHSASPPPPAAAHFHLAGDDSSPDSPPPDVQILTSAGLRIPAHAGVLAIASPVLENIIDNPPKNRSSDRVIPILGVPCAAVTVFIRFLHSSRCTEVDMGKYGIHLLTLSHVYLIPQLKKLSTMAVGKSLSVENVVDVLQLSRLCDAPDLYVKCLKLVSKNFKAVENTEGWKFIQDHDPWLELEILQFIDESEKRKKRSRRQKEERRLYMELGEAMDCLEHICTEGCTSVGPYDAEPNKRKGKPCSKFSTCRGVQLLIKHFATCKKRVNGGCSRCKRMWQLLRLHASICHQPDSCKVPLCRQFRLKMQQEKKGGGDTLWKLLVRKVVSARVMATLSLAKEKKREEES